MSRMLLAACVTGGLLISACGLPHAAVETATRPDQVLAFDKLFAQNCAGCHGVQGRKGAAIALADPAYLAIADDSAIRRSISEGVKGTPMSAFAQSAGGMLTDEQIAVLVTGIRSWANPAALNGASLPSYEAQAAGDAARGQLAFQAYCYSCHGTETQPGKAGSVVDNSYLALVSDHDLRMSVILGRPELGAPDWRNDAPGRPLTEQDVSDVVAWLSSQRVTTPGQPYPERTSLK